MIQLQLTHCKYLENIFSTFYSQYHIKWLTLSLCALLYVHIREQGEKKCNHEIQGETKISLIIVKNYFDLKTLKQVN